MVWVTSSEETEPSPRERREPRWPDALIWAVLVGFSFLQRWGETTFDTKLDLSVDPGGFMERTLSAWNPMSAFGEMQNQAYGYLFPHGLFFYVGQMVNLPDWVIQRLWSGLLLVVAYEGAKRLFRAIDHDLARQWLPMVAGLAYAFSPRLLGLSGALTGEIHPSVMLPWVVLPLVLVLRGRLTPVHGAAWSGVAVVLMGGVNASEVLLALVLPGLLILSAVRTKVGRRLMLWWPLALVAATAWWMAGLLIQGKFAPPFLDYIETSASTTHPLGWSNVMRGANHWLSFVWVGGKPWWSGSYQLSAEPWLILMTGLVAVISLVGLFHRRMPWRLPFGVAVLVAAIILTLGHVDVLGSPFNLTFRNLLDGVLSPFRNIHKLDPVMRLPMALGFAHAVGIASTWVAALAQQRWGAEGQVRARGLMAVAAVVVLLASAQPLFTNDLRKPGWEEMPKAWYEAADFLAERGDTGRTMILPGSGFGQQSWGWTIDEPMQPLAQAPWVSRSQVPLTPGSTIRYLDAIEERIQDGTGSPMLADALARSGVKYVLVRRDLDLWASEAPSPARVDQAINLSPGLKKVAEFGEGQAGGRPMIDIYEVQRNVPLLEAVDITDVKTLAGGPEDTITAMESGLLEPGQVTVNASEEGWTETPDVVGDGFRRRERQFGRLVDAVSQVMSRDEEYRTSRRAHDYHGVSEDDRITAKYTVLSSVSASSSAGYADTLGAIRPENGPFAAVDGSDQTFWGSAPFEDPAGQWLQLNFTRAEQLTGMRLVAGIDTVSGTPVRKVRIEVGERSYERSVDPGTGEVVLPLTGEPVDSVRITVTHVFGNPSQATVALREVSFDGLKIDRTLVLPDKGADADTATTFRARPHRRACVDIGSGPQCDVSSARSSEEENGINRAFTTTEAGTFRMRGQVVARATEDAARLIDPYANQIAAHATSVTGWDPLVSGQRAFDDNPNTVWIAGVGDSDPAVNLTWGKERTIDRLRIEGAPESGSSPTRAVIEAAGETRQVALTQDSMGYFEPIKASSAKITFPMQVTRPDGEPVAPLAVKEIQLDGTKDLRTVWSADARTGAACGFGPDITVNGTKYRTKVTGTQGQVVAGTPMDLEVCGKRQDVELTMGEHELRATSTGQFAVTSLTLEPRGGGPVAPEVRARGVSIDQWDATTRRVSVGAGDEGVLRIPENVNAGWRAELDGEELEPLRLDSWQQGFRLPAGAGGTVKLYFTPDSTYRLQMFLGALLALSMFAVAVVLELRRDVNRTATVTRLPRWLLRGRPRTWILGSLAAYLLGGVPVLVGVVAGAVQSRRGRPFAWAAAVLLSVAFLAQAVQAARGLGVDVSWGNWLAGAAMGLWAATLVQPRGKDEES